MANARSIRFIANSACCFGTNAAWRGTQPACEEALARIPELREEFWHERPRAGRRRRFQSIARTRRSRRRFSRIRRTDVHRCARPATNHAARISAKNIKRRRAKHCATTKISPLSSPGNFKATDSRAAEIASRTASFRDRASNAKEL